MQPLNTFIKRFLCAALISASAVLSAAYAQQPAPTPTPLTESPADDVLRISTELVQTDVMVFDKQGRFIDNLKPEQFELKVDGKPQTISFFERVVAGSANEEVQLAAARGQARSSGPAATEAPARPMDRGRTIFFFIDDLHLTQESGARVRKTLLNFIEKEMAQNDQIAITSASGQIGFLQQLTDNKTVLRAAVARIGFRNSMLRDNEPPAMTLYQALEIQNENREVITLFVDLTLKDNPGLRPNMAESIVRARATRLVQPANSINTSLLASLSSLMQSTAQLPGRKLVFFISEGFLLNARDSDILDRIRRVTDAAARSGTVVYTMDARGLSTGVDDIDQPMTRDLGGKLPSAATEIRAAQDPLQIIAASTGGRALLNSNSLDLGIRKTLQETSIYYLLAWRPDSEQQKSNKFRRIEAKVIGRPELVVRVRNGYFTTPPESKRPKNDAAKMPADPAKVGEAELSRAINAVFPRKDVPTSLFAYYVDTPDSGPLLTVITAVAPEAVTLEMKDGKQTGAVDVGGFVLNDEGKTGANFKSQIQINAEPSRIPKVLKEGLFYTSQIRIKPGLYQVRVAARDTKSGRTGSATQWIEIPDLAARKLTMSSLLVGGRPADVPATQDEANPVTISADRRFTRDSQLRFLTYIYNAAPGPQNATPDVALQVQVFRDNQPVITTPMSQIKTDGLPDMKRLPYAAEVPLDKLLPGHYVLQVSVVDRVAKTSASQQIDFEVL
ncbi:MAG TPA: VWA domain-containing protein [Pyrinomonadaceae bacterium]|nr:VWA domain-containing protein [Pyrinomonadaceae bacterium]